MHESAATVKRPRPGQYLVLVSGRGGTSADLRTAFREFGLLVRRRPVEDRVWRDFWIAWLPGFLPFLLVLIILDPPLFSATLLIALVATAIWAVVLNKALRHFGVIGVPHNEGPGLGGEGQ